MYKVAPYVERCLRSLANQDIPFKDYEIICVNDGSPDNCAEIVMKLQKEIPNIVLINQENQGVSMARNNAIAVAKGKYMMPIDPDDYLVPNCLKAVIDQTESNQLDVLYCAFEIFDVNHQSIWRTDYSELTNKVDNGYEGYFAVRGVKVKDPDRSWAILYRMDVLRKYEIRYPKDVPFLEDGLFLGKVFALVERVGYNDKDFYKRTTRIGSATNSRLFYSEKAISGFIKAVQDIHLFATKNNLKSESKELVNHVVAKFVILSISSSASALRFTEYFKTIAILKLHGLTKIENKGVRFFYKNYVEVYNKSKLLFPLYFCVYKK